MWNENFDYETMLPGGSHLSFDSPYVKLGDMNGDRMEDLIYALDGFVSYFPNMGNGEFDSEIEMTNPPSGLGDRAEKLTAEDIDNNGLTDLVPIGNETLTVWFNPGNNQFNQPVTFNDTPSFFEGASAFRFADLNSDGFRDLLITDENNPTQRYQYIDFNNGVHPYLLTKINNGLGMETTISYKSSTRTTLTTETKALHGQTLCLFLFR